MSPIPAFAQYRKLCSYTHPVLSSAQGDGSTQPTHFRSLGALKKALQAQLQLHFCDLCLENRKVLPPSKFHRQLFTCNCIRSHLIDRCDNHLCCRSSFRSRSCTTGQTCRGISALAMQKAFLQRAASRATQCAGYASQHSTKQGNMLYPQM